MKNIFKQKSKTSLLSESKNIIHAKEAVNQWEIHKARIETKKASIYNVFQQVLHTHVLLVVIVSIYFLSYFILTQIYNIKTHFIYDICEQFAFITRVCSDNCVNGLNVH